MTTTNMEYTPFPKIARLSREIVITEKIDGTNGLVQILAPGEELPETIGAPVVADINDHLIFAGSRTTWITPEKDNYGFAAWVKANAEELVKLGPGRHFGEWWGQGIQRKYGLTEKRWSLFNTGKWLSAHAENPPGDPMTDKRVLAPNCCHVVPVITMGVFDRIDMTDVLLELQANGSKAAPGFMSPEGIIIYHTQGNLYFKKTLSKDEEWKGKQL